METYERNRMGAKEKGRGGGGGFDIWKTIRMFSTG